MYSICKSTIIAVAMIALLAGFAPVPTDTHSLKAGLRLSNAPGYQEVITGHGWKPRARLAFTVSEGSLAEGLEVRADLQGRFVLAMTQLTLCSHPVFTAHDLHGHAATVQGPALGCPVPAYLPPPVIQVLRGKKTSPRVTTIQGLAPRRVDLRVGDELDISETGATIPSYVPHVDGAYLIRIRQGVASIPDCVQPDCIGGYVWQYIAVRFGQTVIDMAPGCRLLRPACGLPDLAIEVRLRA